MADQTWATVPYFPAYEVSTLGAVRSNHRGSKLLKPMMTGAKGRQYETVMLCNAGTKRIVKVHVLVLEVFVGARPTGCVACHKDDNRRNNSVDNLYWGTQKTNARDRVRNRHHSGQRLTVEQVVEIRARREAGERGVDLAREFGVSQQSICGVYKGRTGGYLHG